MWVPVGAWCVAAVVALVVLGFCVYEISWKARRLQRDLRRLQGLAERVPELHHRLAEVQRRLAATGLR